MKKSSVIIAVSCSVAAVGAAVAAVVIGVPMYKYNTAMDSFENKEYHTAISQFRELGSYSDSREKVVEVYQQIAYDMLSSSSYEEVQNKFSSDTSYSDYYHVIDKAVYQKANDAFEAGTYIDAVEFFSLIPEYENSSEMVNECYYQQGLVYFENGEYDSAVTEFKKVTEYKDSSDKITESHYAKAEKLLADNKPVEAAKAFSDAGEYKDSFARIREIGLDLIEKKEYSDASDVLKYDPDSFDHYNYAMGMLYYEKGDYSPAVTYLGRATSVEGADKVLAEAEKLLEEKNNQELFKKADLHYSNGELNQALRTFEKLPADYSYNGVSVSERLATLEKYSKYVDICGKWTSTATNYAESRQTYKRTGSAEWWYKDIEYNPESKIFLDVKCTIKSDGTVRISGKAGFYRFTDYSSISAYVDGDYTTISFNETVSTYPYTLNINDNTTLTFNANSISLAYSEKDNYSTSFYNTYSSNYTYNKRNVSY